MSGGRWWGTAVRQHWGRALWPPRLGGVLPAWVFLTLPRRVLAKTEINGPRMQPKVGARSERDSEPDSGWVAFRLCSYV